MIDLHSHILPGVDDGAAAIEESLQLALLYREMGFKQVVATPHARTGKFSMIKAGDVTRGVDRLNAQLLKSGIELQVLPGMEAELDVTLPGQIKNREVLTLAHGNFVLVETPFFFLPRRWETVVFELAIHDIKVIFAHPERCAQLMDKPALAEQMVKAGAFLQCNWDSFQGRYGRDAFGVVGHLARRGLIHFLATDSHKPGSRDPRMIARSSKTIVDMMGEDNFNLVSKDNPARILEGRDPVKMNPEAVPPSHSYSRFSRVMSKSITGFFTRLNKGKR